MHKPKEQIKNIAKCLLCGDIIESKHRHDFVTCKCGNLSVDGGLEYFKRSLLHGTDSYEELCFETNEEYKELNCCDDCDLNNPDCNKCIGS